MGRRRNKGRQHIVGGKSNNVAKSHIESRTTKVVLNNDSNIIIVNTTTVGGDLSEHRKNVIQRVEQSIQVVEEFDLSNAREKVAKFASVDEQWTKVMGNKTMKVFMEECMKNPAKITTKPLSFALSK